MKVSFTMDFRNPRGEAWRQFWEDRLWLMGEAEAMGFDQLLIQEHYFTYDGYAPSIPIFQTALIERTKNVDIGSYTYVLPLHNAAQLAQETAVLDQMSGGRLHVCVGAGHRPAEYRAWGYNPKTRPSRMEEGLQVLKLGWTGGPFSFEGRYYSLKDVVIAPTPLQKPHPPLWVAATMPAAAERAGRYGANLAGVSDRPEFYEAYFRGLAQSGVSRDAVRLSASCGCTVTDEDPEKVWQRNRELHFERWRFYAEIREEMGDPDLEGHRPDKAAPLTPEQFRDADLIGDASTVIGVLRQRKDAAPWLTDFVHSGPAGGVDIRTEAYQDLKKFAEEVMPTLKGW
jgi:alkanesulfonate monooxygenase SsuD/methylene tetrahydromethanopterin reductase-like flavin-dependent oxidoreductase (luciferase family)